MRVVVLAEAALLDELRERAPQRLRFVGEAALLQRVVQEPVDDRPGRPAPEEGRFARVIRWLAARHRRHGQWRGEFSSGGEVALDDAPGDLLIELFDGEGEEEGRREHAQLLAA